MFRTVPLAIIRSFSAWSKLSANLYDKYHYWLYSEKLLMMASGTVRNM